MTNFAGERSHRAAHGPTLQERQKQKSRESILQAAKEIFAEKSYATAAIEDVIARANVSRATFYKYFDSKFALGRELHAGFSPRLAAVFDQLLSFDNPTEQDLVDWIGRLVELYREEKDQIVTSAHMLAIEPAFHPIMIDIIRDIEQRWALRIPAFRVSGSNAPDAMRARIESRLLLRQLNDFCYEVAIFDWKIDVTEGSRIMAGYFRDFIERYRPNAG
ncbi:MAG: transcriptional regulator, TetR family [Rhodospirillales bacterium]|nr:transcriptional regulator, TetR family [Rhodospirillales bacterium]